MDEVGSAIAYSEDPNCICVPFLYFSLDHKNIIPYSIVWPCKDIEREGTLTRDYCPRWMKDPKVRDSYLHTILQGDSSLYIGSYKVRSTTPKPFLIKYYSPYYLWSFPDLHLQCMVFMYVGVFRGVN